MILSKKKNNKEAKMKHLIDIKDLSTQEIDELIEVAKDIIKNKEKYSKKFEEKLIKVNHAKVLYDTNNLVISKVINHQ